MHGVVWERQCLNVAFQLTHDVDVHTLCYEVLPKLYSCLPRFTLHLQPHHPSLSSTSTARCCVSLGKHHLQGMYPAFNAHIMVVVKMLTQRQVKFLAYPRKLCVCRQGGEDQRQRPPCMSRSMSRAMARAFGETECMGSLLRCWAWVSTNTYQFITQTRRHADTQTRRHADTQTQTQIQTRRRRHADETRRRRHADAYTHRTELHEYSQTQPAQPSTQ